MNKKRSKYLWQFKKHFVFSGWEHCWSIWMTGSPEEQVQVGCIVAASDLLLHHSQRLQLVTAETNNNRWIFSVYHGCLCVCFHALPAVDSSACVFLQCPAAAVCPRPLVAIPGQTQAAVHGETVTDLLTHKFVSGGFSKISSQQGQVTKASSYRLL